MNAVYDLLRAVTRGEVGFERTEEVREAVQAARAQERIARAIAPGHNFRDDFWTTPEGDLIARVENWLYGPDLLTQNEAAMLLYDMSEEEVRRDGNNKAYLNLYQFPANNQPPKLTRYWKPGTRYAIRLLRQEVEALKRQREAGELPPGPKPKQPAKRTPRYEPPNGVRL